MNLSAIQLEVVSDKTRHLLLIDPMSAWSQNILDSNGSALVLGDIYLPSLAYPKHLSLNWI